MAKISIHGDVVTMVQSTKVKDGIDVELTQRYDFTDTPKTTLIQWATANRVIAWRAHNDVKNINVNEIKALPTDIDCSTEFETTRKVRVENPFMMELKAISVKTGVPMDKLLQLAAMEAAKVVNNNTNDNEL